MRFLHYLKNEFKLMRRDMILVTFALFVVYLGVVLRFLLPWLNGYLMESGILPGKNILSSLSDYYPVILSNFVVFTGPLIGGTMFAFLILTEKDDHTIKAILVSPLSPGRYVANRLISSSFFSLLILLFLFYVIDINVLSFHKMVILSLGAATTAPLVMLFLVILSDSKVQGMNYSKVLSFLGFLIVLSFFIKGPAQYAFGLFAPYWISKAYWSAAAGEEIWYIYLVIGVVAQCALTWVLMRVVMKRIYKEL